MAPRGEGPCSAPVFCFALQRMRSSLLRKERLPRHAVGVGVSTHVFAARFFRGRFAFEALATVELLKKSCPVF